MLEIAEKTLSRNCSSFNKISSTSDRVFSDELLSLASERRRRAARVERAKAKRGRREVAAATRCPSCLIALEGRVAGGIGRRRKMSLVRNTKLLLSRSMLKRKQKTSLLCCFYPRGSICHNISSRHILPILRDPSKTINSRVLGFQYMCSWGGAAKRSDIHLTPGPLFALFHP